jgi:sulfite exporter TauE/SafE
VFAECAHNFAAQYGLVFSLFVGGLVGSVTHCAGMCGPFVLAQTARESSFSRMAGAALLPYHLGRMTTYVGLGVVLNSLINVSFLYSDLKPVLTAPLLVTAALLFLISAFPRLAMAFPWLANIRLAAPYGLIQEPARKLSVRSDILGRYGLGLLLGFMPCGLVLAALMAASTASSVLQAALAMAAFAAGTTPALVAVGFLGKGLAHKYPNTTKRLSQSAMVVSSLWLFVLAGMLIF